MKTRKEKKALKPTLLSKGFEIKATRLEGGWLLKNRESYNNGTIFIWASLCSLSVILMLVFQQNL